ncbi:MAG: DUF1501 domain-containing protein [Planctomycetota bacterium]|nr:DUF1501 domain-containing protein [Planctomycetota bacterium]MDA1211122.1 DUF1501 domain-containing protein [Planctomycetota bacterium]
MKSSYACNSIEHEFSRRAFLGGLAAGTATWGLGDVLTGLPALAEPFKSGHKRILNVFLHGGVSQLETWDPKPNTDTGGPFRAIPTSVPGIHVCELLPYTAQQMHRLSIIRSIDTHNSDHARGVVEMTTGRKQLVGIDYPHLGAVAAKALTPDHFTLPGHILVRSSPGERNVESEFHKAAYLGAQYANMTMYDAHPPKNTERAETLTREADASRNALREKISNRFAGRRRTADTEAYNFSFEQARELLTHREVFDVTQESAADRERYGTSEFGKHCLLARRLLERGIPYVQVNHADYDTHHENFDFHIEQLGEFDRPFSQLIADLSDRGLLAETLVCVMSEFGRTPRINDRYGRDHWGTAWSVALGGTGIQPGGVIGKTNDNGTEVIERSVDHGHVFHTIMQAVGVNSTGDFDIGGRKFPIADPAKSAIGELLA